MDLRDAASLTAASIRTHKMRSMLAAIGVVLGIGSVIGVVTMGAGFQESILGTFTSGFDADIVSLSVEDTQQQRGGPPSVAPVSVFTDRDVDALGALDHAKAAGATGPIAAAEARLGDEALEGVTIFARRGADFAKLAEGRNVHGPGEAVVSDLTAKRLIIGLGRASAIDTQLVIRYPSGDMFETASVTIVGVEEPAPFLATETITVDASYAPTLVVNDAPTHVWRSVTLRADSASDAAALKDEARAYVEGESDARDRLHERYAFRYDTQESVTSLISTAINQFTAFIGGLGAVALLVGLVGIANIMLVSVSERTREIGVMKATGATSGDVMLVFLVESVAICLVGATLGIGLGMIMGLGLNALVAAMSGGETTVPFVLVPEWYALAVFLGVLTGLVAGLYPAWRAAKVSPVEALRYE